MYSITLLVLFSLSVIFGFDCFIVVDCKVKVIWWDSAEPEITIADKREFKSSAKNELYYRS